VQRPAFPFFVPPPSASNPGPVVNPEDILRYYEIRERAQGRTGGISVPFYLPNQTPQNLIMESEATYRQVAPPAEEQ
jgi:hypothetical protein